MHLYDENDRKLMRRTMAYSMAMLRFNLAIIAYSILWFIPSMTEAIIKTEAERDQMEKYPERMFGFIK